MQKQYSEEEKKEADERKQLFKNIRENLKTFHKDIILPGGSRWNHVNTLNKIDLYLNSEFESGPYDSQGYQKYFYNIIVPACRIATKFIDLDTKDIMLTSTKPGQDFKVWLMQRDLRYWLKTNQFAEFLNEVGDDYPKYGSVVSRDDHKTKIKVGKVNIQNLRMQPWVKFLHNSSFVYLVIPMDKGEMLKMPGWNKEQIEAVCSKLGDNVIVYECLHKNMSGEGKAWKRYYVADLFSYNEGEGQNMTVKHGTEALLAKSKVNYEFNDGHCLYEDEVDEFCYNELHFEKAPGRWLGVGFAENLFHAQVRQNEVSNISAKNLLITSLVLFQSQDETVKRNLLTQAVNGQILNANQPITRIDMGERNLASFNLERQTWDKNAKDLTFAFDISTGENLPSGTPLGVARISASMVQSFFERKREQFGIFVKRIIEEKVLPSFKESSSNEHILKLINTDTELDKLRELIVETQISKEMLKFVVKKMRVPTPEEIEVARKKMLAELANRKDLSIKIAKGLYSDLDYNVDVVVVSEQMDFGAKGQTLQAVLQIIAGNPTIMTNPITRAIFSKILELQGLSVVDLNMIEEKSRQAQGENIFNQIMQARGGMPMGGGSGSAPTGQPAPVVAR